MLITYLILKYLFNLQDPYEKIHVYVAPSTISDLAGEGLFAKKVIKKGQLICLFNGVRRCKEGRIRTVIGVNSDEWSDYRLILGTINPKLDRIFRFKKKGILRFFYILNNMPLAILILNINFSYPF